VDLSTMPIYVRAGAIVPLDPVRQYTAQKVSEPTTLKIHPGADGVFTLYDDDGTTLDYQRNVAAWTRLSWNDRARTLTIEPDPRSKLKPAASRPFDVVLATGGDRERVLYEGKRIRVKF